jgi:type IV secretory pathway VirD2 relaxase
MPKLVHKILFSMPAGTPPDKLFAAVRNFARQGFADRHRYALALHTDEPHPHVHVVLKAMTEDGEHFNIRKPMLRVWRQEFASHLRAQGVAAKATARAVRDQARPNKLKGIYRAANWGRSGVAAI